MPAVKTHYENLQISRTASIEVVRGAYKYLSQKYHPDKNPPEKCQECERVMKIINEAYEVLSDPPQRKRHDEWIDAMLKQETTTTDSSNTHSDTYKDNRFNTSALKDKADWRFELFISFFIALCILIPVELVAGKSIGGLIGNSGSLAVTVIATAIVHIIRTR